MNPKNSKVISQSLLPDTTVITTIVIVISLVITIAWEKWKYNQSSSAIDRLNQSL